MEVSEAQDKLQELETDLRELEVSWIFYRLPISLPVLRASPVVISPWYCC